MFYIPLRNYPIVVQQKIYYNKRDVLKKRKYNVIHLIQSVTL